MFDKDIRTALQIPFQQHDHATGASWRSAAFSLCAHGLILLLLLLWFSGSQPASFVEAPRGGEIVLTRMSSDAEVQYVTKDDVSNDPDSDVSKSSVQAEFPPSLPVFEVSDLDLAGAMPVDSSADTNSMANEPTSGVRFEYKFSGADLDAIEADRKHFEAIEAVGPPASISIFGSGDLTGRKFVFLIDRSKSMGEQGLRVLRNATSQLVSGINELQENHFFQIIAYNDHVTVMKQKKLLQATASNKKLVPEFMTNLLAYGGTNHVGAFYTALSFKPDVILVLNDGGIPELNGGQIEQLSRLSGNTAIHVLHFGAGNAQSKNHFMQQVAEACSGTYRYIDVRKWQKNQ